MLRELNLNEMEMVSGGHGPGGNHPPIPQDGHTDRAREAEDWLDSQNDGGTYTCHENPSTGDVHCVRESVQSLTAVGGF